MATERVKAYKKVFITGANGFIGKSLGNKYHAAGADVCGIDFQPDESRNVVAGNLATPAAWQHLLDGCDLVIHTAAVVSNTAGTDFTWQVNVKGTADLLELAAAAGVQRFLHLSSTAAFGFEFPADVAESYPVKMNGNPYVDSKIASEHAVLACHASGDMNCTIVRPSDVYGPGSKPWIITPLELIAKGQFILPAHGQSLFSPVYIDDLLEGITFAAGKKSGAGQIFTIGGGYTVTCEEYFGHHYRWLGKPGKPKSVSSNVARLMAGVINQSMTLLGKQTEVGTGTVDMLDRKNGYSIDKAKSLLGYNPQMTLQQGMENSRLWLMENGYL